VKADNLLQTENRSWGGTQSASKRQGQVNVKELQQPTKKPSEGACFHSPMDLTSATEALKRHQRSIAEDRYLSDPHARVHRAFTGSQHCYQRWQRDWFRDQCVTVAQVCTDHSPLAVAYLHRIGHRDSAIMPTPSRRRRNSRTSGVPMSGPRSGQEGHVVWRQFYNWSTTPLKLPGTDWGGDPPWPGRGERESKPLPKPL